MTLSVPFPIPPAPGDTLAPCKAIPTLGRAAIVIPMRCSASPVSPAGWGPSVLVSPAKGLLHPPLKFPHFPPSRFSSWPAPMPTPSPSFPSMGLGWGLGACGVVEAKQCLHLLEKRALGHFPASAPQNFPGNPGGAPSTHLTGTKEGGPGCKISRVLPAPWASCSPCSGGKGCQESKRGNWGSSLVSCMKKIIAWHKSSREIKGRGYSSCLCRRDWVHHGLGDTRGSQG